MSNQHLPPAIVAASNGLAVTLAAHVAAHPDTALATLAADVFGAVRTALPGLLQAVLPSSPGR